MSLQLMGVENEIRQLKRRLLSEETDLKEIQDRLKVLEKQKETLDELLRKTYIKNDSGPSFKPGIKFQDATMNDVTRPDGLGLDTSHISDAASLFLPADFVIPAPSDAVCVQLNQIKRVWSLDNKRSFEIVINTIITDVLSTEGNEGIVGHTKVKNNWEGSNYSYRGQVDYMFGKHRILSTAIRNLLLLTQSDIEWNEAAIAQVLCEAGCLLKNRLANGKKTPVFAILTSGWIYRFFVIDVDCVAYASDTFTLAPGQDGSFYSSTSLREILRWFQWFTSFINADPDKIDITNCLNRIASN